MKKGRITQEIIEYVQNNPGSESQDIFDALPNVYKLGTVQNTLNRLERLGVLQNRGGRANRFTPAKWYPNDPFISERAKELARDIYAEMIKQHHTVREQFLAEKINDLLVTQTKGES